MSGEQAEELGEVRARAREAAEVLEAQAAEVMGFAKRIEEPTGSTPEWYPGMRTRVEAEETLRQARVLVRAMEHLGGGTNRKSKDVFQDR